MSSKLPLVDFGDVHDCATELQRATSRAAVDELAPMLARGERTSGTVARLSPCEQRQLGELAMDTRAALSVVLYNRIRRRAASAWPRPVSASTWVC